MQPSGSLAATFQDYLASGLDVAPRRDLRRLLGNAGLTDEEQALKTYWENGPGASFTCQQGAWKGCTCHVGPMSPKTAEPGALWFDVVELTAMVLVPSKFDPSPDRWQWHAIHPTFVWQFRAFLSLAKAQANRTEFKSAEDFLSPDRFKQMDPMAFVTDMYHEEAWVYAIWFGKGLSGQAYLQSAKAFLSAASFGSLLPEGMRLWEGTPPAESEFVRVAVGRNTLEKRYFEELEKRAAEKAPPANDRIVFEEWERSMNIGFSTKVSFKGGPYKKMPRGGAFVTLQNCAPRP